MKPALHALAALLALPALALAGGYDKPENLSGQPAWLDTATGQWHSSPPDNRPEFKPTGPVIYKVTIATDTTGRDVIGTYWCKDKPSPGDRHFITLDGEVVRLREGTAMRADWWDPETARKSDYGANPDALAVHLTDADRADIRSRHPFERAGEGVPAPLLWIGAGLGLLFIFLTTRPAAH